MNSSYIILKKQSFSDNEYSIMPIRMEDRYDIMKWRNEQIYHLRQARPLTEADQDNYFTNIVSKLFNQESPGQILFSYLENGKCIGYGGLVHINWIDKNAEISFIINTELEKDFFHKHWSIYLRLIEQVAFEELSLHKIYTYAFDIRPHLYATLESVGFAKEATLKEHCIINGEYRDVVFHSKWNHNLILRKANLSDKEIVFEWASDKLTRSNSFSTETITYEGHTVWYDNKMKDNDAYYLIGEINKTPIGLVRFDKSSNGSIVIGILIDEKFRGKGLAASFIRKACNEYLTKNPTDVFALIKSANKASVKSFVKAGFHFEEEIMVNGINALKYKLSSGDIQ